MNVQPPINQDNFKIKPIKERLFIPSYGSVEFNKSISDINEVFDQIQDGKLEFEDYAHNLIQRIYDLIAVVSAEASDGVGKR